MRSYNRQNGASFAGWLILILVLGTIITVGTKLVPLYVDHNTIANIMDKLAAENGMADKRKSEIIKLLGNRLKLNNIRDFPMKDRLTIDYTKNGTDLKLDYEVRIPFFSNVDLIASFNKEIELRK